MPPQYDAFLAASEAISQLHAEVEDMKAAFAADNGFALGGDGDIFAQVTLLRLGFAVCLKEDRAGSFCPPRVVVLSFI